MRNPLYLSLLALAFCAGLAGADPFSDLLAANKAKWQARQPAHYTYLHSKSCYCEAITWQVEVENGTLKDPKLMYIIPSFPVTVPNNLGIDSVFEWVRRTKAGNPEEMKVTYDPEFGFPSSIQVDQRKLATDDETSIGISLFKVVPQGLTLSRDTLYAWKWPGVVDSQNQVRITNTGADPLYLNKIAMSVTPTDTFPGLGAALRFYHNLPDALGNPDRIFLRNAGPYMKDSSVELPNAILPPGGSMLLLDFNFDPCFCLIKTAAKISDGDPVTLLLRLDFSRGVRAERTDVRAYVTVRAKYGYTSGIARPGLRSERGVSGNARPGRAAVLFTLGERVFEADGRNAAPIGASGSR